MNKMFTFMRESSIARFFIPTGIILIIFGIFMFIVNNSNRDYIPIEAIVSNVELLEDEMTDADGNRIEATYSVNVKYTVDGKEYNEKLENVSKYNVGDKMKIYYNPKDPSQITQTKSLVLPVIIFVLGIASLTFGIVSIMNAIKKNVKMKEQERSWNNA